MGNTLREMQLCILDIALEFRRICDKHNLNYFLVGGTLLGAVRHHGFIPWDDDMDVGMLREDYEKFLKICPQELGQDFFFQTSETDEAYAFPYAKIRLHNTLLAEDYAKDSKQHNGVFLDVFPYDHMPEQKLLQKAHYFLFKGLKWAGLGKTDYIFLEEKKKKFSKAMGYLFFPFGKKRLVRWSEAVCRVFYGRNCKNAVNLCGAYGYREYTEIENLKNTQLLNFEGYQFKVPGNCEHLLTQMYGTTYMELPPVEKRGNQHSVVQLDLKEYVIKNNVLR